MYDVIAEYPRSSFRWETPSFCYQFPAVLLFSVMICLLLSVGDWFKQRHRICNRSWSLQAVQWRCDSHRYLLFHVISSPSIKKTFSFDAVLKITRNSCMLLQ